MSYSFNFRVATKEEVEDRLDEELDKVVERHPVHAVDIGIVEEAVNSAVHTLRDAENKQISVTVSGHCHRIPTPEGEPISEDDEEAGAAVLDTVSFSVTLSLVDAPTE